eukprot:s1_g869.t1
MLKKTKQVRAEKTRDGLIRAAIDVVRKAGYENARIQDISDRAGVTPGAILYHFRNLETLLMEAFRADFDELMHIVEPDAPLDLSNEALVDLMAGIFEDKAFRVRIGVLTEFLIAARNDNKRRKLVEDVMRTNRERMIATSEKFVGREIDGERLWEIIDIAISLLIAEQLNYPNAAQSSKAFENALPFVKRELKRFLDENQ